MVKSTVTSLIRRFTPGHLTPWAPVPPGIRGAAELCGNEKGGVCPDKESKEAREEKNLKSLRRGAGLSYFGNQWPKGRGFKSRSGEIR
jgi:hypothetical protein